METDPNAPEDYGVKSFQSSMGASVQREKIQEIRNYYVRAREFSKAVGEALQKANGNLQSIQSISPEERKTIAIPVELIQNSLNKLDKMTSDLGKLSANMSEQDVKKKLSRDAVQAIYNEIEALRNSAKQDLTNAQISYEKVKNAPQGNRDSNRMNLIAAINDALTKAAVYMKAAEYNSPY